MTNNEYLGSNLFDLISGKIRKINENVKSRIVFESDFATSRKTTMLIADTFVHQKDTMGTLFPIKDPEGTLFPIKLIFGTVECGALC